MVVVRLDGTASGLDVGQLYAANALRVRGLVARGIRAPEPVIDDACQIAWGRLVRHHRRVCADTAVAWLVTTALREALRLLRRASRDVSLEQVIEQSGELPTVAAPAPDEMVQRRARLDAVTALPERQQRLVWLQALGWSYPEMAGRTGTTTRTVDRQLVRARRKLREVDPGLTEG